MIDGGGGSAFLPASLSARMPARKPRTKPDPVTEAAQAAVNRLAELRQQLMAGPDIAGGAARQLRPIPPPGAQLIFILDAAATKATGMLHGVHRHEDARAGRRDARRAQPKQIETPEGTVAVNRGWSAAKPLTLAPPDVARITEKADRNLVALLTSAAQSAYYGGYRGCQADTASGGPGRDIRMAGPFGHRHQPLAIPGGFHATVLAALCDSGRAFLSQAEPGAEPGVAYHRLGWNPRAGCSAWR